MFSFVIKRLLQAILVMLIVTLIAFLLFQFVGDPVTQMLGQEATEADRLALTHELGLDQPIWKQFGAFIANTLHGDFGMSLRQGAPVVDLFKEKMPATLELAFFSAMVATLIGIPLGVFVALKRNSIWASWLMGLSLVGISLPTFFIGILLILVFSVWLGWLPSYGRRRDGCIWLVDNRPAHRRWSETYHPPRGDFGDLSNCSGDALGTQ